MGVGEVCRLIGERSGESFGGRVKNGERRDFGVYWLGSEEIMFINKYES